MMGLSEETTTTHTDMTHNPNNLVDRMIYFSVDAENRQLVARKRNGVWSMIERDTTRKNAIVIIPLDDGMIDDLERIKE